MAIILTNDALLDGSNRFARALDRAGVPARGAVAVLLQNTPEFLWAYRGATGSGRRFTPLSWRWTPAEVDCVVGAPDDEWGEAVRAVVELVPEESESDHPNQVLDLPND